MRQKQTETKPWLWQMVQNEGRSGSGGRVTEKSFVKDDAPATHMEKVLRRALLLNSPEASLPGLSLAVTYAPAFAEQGPVGGDFFDAFALPGGTNEVALLIGDMTGKGIEVAVHIAAVKFALRAFLREPAKEGLRCPGNAFARLNDFVCHAQVLDGWDPAALVSAALVVVDTVTGQARFALAAAEAPFVLPNERGKDHDYGSMPYGLPLGAFANQQYETASLCLPVGATLFLLTDGLTEARCPARTPTGELVFLGCEGVARLAEKEPDAKGRPLPAMGREVLEQARAYAGGRLSDDACLLLVRRHGK